MANLIQNSELYKHKKMRTKVGDKKQRHRLLEILSKLGG